MPQKSNFTANLSNSIFFRRINSDQHYAGKLAKIKMLTLFSQKSININNFPHLDSIYTVFGRRPLEVVAGGGVPQLSLVGDAAQGEHLPQENAVGPVGKKYLMGNECVFLKKNIRTRRPHMGKRAWRGCPCAKPPAGARRSVSLVKNIFPIKTYIFSHFLTS